MGKGGQEKSVLHMCVFDLLFPAPVACCSAAAKISVCWGSKTNATFFLHIGFGFHRINTFLIVLAIFLQTLTFFVPIVYAKLINICPWLELSILLLCCLTYRTAEKPNVIYVWSAANMIILFRLYLQLLLIFRVI